MTKNSKSQSDLRDNSKDLHSKSSQNNKSFLQQLGIGISSLTFGVALSIFIYAIGSGIVSGVQAWLLFVASFLLMLRFWWRYNELFVQNIPSQNYWHFLLDFAISFFGILAVLFVGNIQLWALAGIGAMIASMIRCGLSWSDAKNSIIKSSLKKTIIGSVVMFIIIGIVYSVAFFFDPVMIAGVVLVLVIVFVGIVSRKS